jgi:hypothetical protein
MGSIDKSFSTDIWVGHYWRIRSAGCSEYAILEQMGINGGLSNWLF